MPTVGTMLGHEDILESKQEDIRDQIRTYSGAKADRVYLDEFRKVKKALLMKRAQANGVDAVAAQEREAYADPEYQTLLQGLKEATENEAAAYWHLKLYEWDFERWRSKEATRRQEIQRYGIDV